MKRIFIIALLLLAAVLVFAFPWDGQQPQGTTPDEPQFASTLSTAEQSEFFSYPDWWPDDVGSEDTPGSVDWYVEGVTGMTYSVGFKVYVNGVAATNLAVQPTEGSFPDTNNVYYWTKPFADDDEDCGETDALTNSASAPIGFRWLGRHEIQFGTNTVWITNTYTAKVSQYTNATWYTGFWQGRAARLTPDVIAGVNSTFEALYERMYYASQYGGSTNWTVTVTNDLDSTNSTASAANDLDSTNSTASVTNCWGGTTPETFRLDGAADTNYLDNSFLQDYHNPTDGVNRTMKRELYTKRLDELENILRFTGESVDFRRMCGTNCPPAGAGIAGGIGQIFKSEIPARQAFRISRPTWPEVWQWSSSMFDDLDGEQEIPTVAWTDNPWEAGGGDDVWLKCCRPLRALDGYHVYEITPEATNETTNVVHAHTFDWPIETAFRNLMCGEDFWFRDCTNGWTVYDSTNALIRHTFDGMLTNFYRSCCTTSITGGMLTNFYSKSHPTNTFDRTFATRRLQSDALARANQRLSALDRTIMDGQVAHTNLVQDRLCTAEIAAEGTVTLTYDSFLQWWEPQYATWNSITNETNVFTNEGYAADGERKVRHLVQYNDQAEVNLAAHVPYVAAELYMRGEVSSWAKEYGPVHFVGYEETLYGPMMAMVAENDPDHIRFYEMLFNEGGVPPTEYPIEFSVYCIGMKSGIVHSEMPESVDRFRLVNSLQPLDSEVQDKIDASTVSTFVSARSLHRNVTSWERETNIAYRISSDSFTQPSDLLDKVKDNVDDAFDWLTDKAENFTGWDGSSAPKIGQDDIAHCLGEDVLWNVTGFTTKTIYDPDWDPTHEVASYVVNTNGEVEALGPRGEFVRIMPWPFHCVTVYYNVGLVEAPVPPEPSGEHLEADGEARYYDVETVDWEWDAVRRDKKY